MHHFYIFRFHNYLTVVYYTHMFSVLHKACVPALQEGLVSLLDEQSEEDECIPHVRKETNSEENPPKVEKAWHRVIGQRLVFGALLAPTNQV